MNGIVDNEGRSLLAIEVRANPTSQAVAADVWVDTDFTGDLVLPKSIICSMALPHSGSVDAILADGSQIECSTYTCFIQWFGQERRLEVVANEGEYPLLGVGLLIGLELRIDYHDGKLTLTRRDR
jgi:clan AA aspartic protease